MNINRIINSKLLMVILSIMGCLLNILGCTSNNDCLNAYLYNVTDCYPIKRTNNDVDSMPTGRYVKFHFMLKNESPETYCLPFGFNGREAFSMPYIHFSVQKDDKTIVLDRHETKGSCICHKFADTDLLPNDSAIVVLTVYKYVLDSLGIDILTSASDLVNTLKFTSKYDGGEKTDSIVPTIVFHNNNMNKIVTIDSEEKRMREYWDVHIDSINNIVYAYPHYWKVPIEIPVKTEK